MRETWVRSLGQEDSLEKGMATHSSIFAWRTPQTEEPGRLQSMGRRELDMTEQVTLLSFLGCKWLESVTSCSLFAPASCSVSPLSCRAWWGAASSAPAFFQALRFSLGGGDGCLEAVLDVLGDGVWALSVLGAGRPALLAGGALTSLQ